jgi:hypothetical protein
MEYMCFGLVRSYFNKYYDHILLRVFHPVDPNRKNDLEDRVGRCVRSRDGRQRAFAVISLLILVILLLA